MSASPKLIFLPCNKSGRSTSLRNSYSVLRFIIRFNIARRIDTTINYRIATFFIHISLVELFSSIYFNIIAKFFKFYAVGAKAVD